MRISSVLLTILFVSVFSFATAQDLITCGFKLGAIQATQERTYSPQSLIQSSGTNVIWGWDAGVFLRHSLNRHVALAVELHYLQRGRSVTVMATVLSVNPQGFVDLGPVEIKERSHHLSVPILAQFRIDYDKIVPYVALGPRIEYMLLRPESVSYDQFKRWEFGGTITAGIQVSPGFIPEMLVEVAYNTNFTDAYSNQYVTITNRSFSFLVGAIF
jgi:hypothetical protein